MSDPGTPAARLPLFVYGSLKRGEANHHLLAGVEPLGAAETAAGFELVDLGPYPGMVGGGGGGRVAGELYRADAAVVERLDAFEGHPGYFCRTAIELSGGRPAEAYLVGRRHVRGRPWLVPPAEPADGPGGGGPVAVVWRSSRPRPPR